MGEHIRALFGIAKVVINYVNYLFYSGNLLIEIHNIYANYLVDKLCTNFLNFIWK